MKSKLRVLWNTSTTNSDIFLEAKFNKFNKRFPLRLNLKQNALAPMHTVDSTTVTEVVQIFSLQPFV